MRLEHLLSGALMTYIIKAIVKQGKIRILFFFCAAFSMKYKIDNGEELSLVLRQTSSPIAQLVRALH